MVGEPNQGAAGAAPDNSTTRDRGSSPFGGESPLSVETLGGAYEDRPELFVGAAFLGGFVVARILKKVGG
jgi:hypothetical protein